MLKHLFIFITCFSTVLSFSLQLDSEPKTSLLYNNISVVVLDAASGNQIFAHNPKTPRLIASNVKLFTALSALELLKLDFHWHTFLSYTGRIQNGVLYGNVYLRGGGDPTLDDKALYLIIGKLKSLGVNRVAGRLIIDDTLFTTLPTYSMLEYTNYDPDTVKPNALVINSNLTKFTFTIKNNQILIKHDLHTYKLNNNLHLDVNAKCQNLYQTIKLKLYNKAKSIDFSGKFPMSCGIYPHELDLVYNLFAPRTYNQMALERILAQFSIKISGGYGYAPQPPNAIVVFDYSSPNIVKVLMDMNWFSSNLIAETVFLSLGTKFDCYLHNLCHKQDTYQSAKTVFNQYLQQLGINLDLFNIENGAGLSRHEKVSLEDVASLLLYAQKSPYQGIFEATLPVSQFLGTLKRAFPEFALRFRAKTGSLNDTLAYAGYFNAQNGHKYILAAVINDIRKDPNIVKVFNSVISSILKQLDILPK